MGDGGNTKSATLRFYIAFMSVDFGNTIFLVICTST